MTKGKRPHTSYERGPLALSSRPVVPSSIVRPSQVYKVYGNGGDINCGAYCVGIGSGLAHLVGFGSD